MEAVLLPEPVAAAAEEVAAFCFRFVLEKKRLVVAILVARRVAWAVIVNVRGVVILGSCRGADAEGMAERAGSVEKAARGQHCSTEDA